MNFRLSFPIIIFFIACLNSCVKESQEIETIRLSDDLYIEETDTISPQYTVYRLDSFATSGSNMAIIGSVADPNFGRIESITFSRFKLAANDYQTVGAANEYYDSIVLIMHSDSAWYGDTLSDWRVAVHKLKQAFDPSVTTYYNQHSLLPYDEVLGETAVRFRPSKDDSVRIRLSDDFGREIFNFYKTKHANIQEQENFQQYLHGLQISNAADNKVIYRFPVTDSTLFIRLYYHEDMGAPVVKHLDYAAEGSPYQFNKISCDVSSSELQSLVPGASIPSDQLNHRIYLNDLAGIGAKINFPSAKRIAALPNFVIIASASLNIKPIAGSFDKFPLIPYIGMSLRNESGISSTPLYSSDNNYIQTGNLFIDALNGISTGYSYDVATFIRDEISATEATSSTADLKAYSASGSAAFSMQRLVAADNRHPLQPSSLTAQLIFYKK